MISALFRSWRMALTSTGRPTTGTFTFSLDGNLTCTSTENIVGTVDIVWADSSVSYADITTLALNLGSLGGAA